MRKKVLCVLTVLFFGLLLLGTLFHQNIDGMFREHVAVVNPQPYVEEVQEIWEADGGKREIITLKNYLLIPKDAVHNNMVYMVETVEEAYGTYEVVRLKFVESADEVDGMVKIKNGLSEKDRVVAVFGEKLEDGMRVVVNREHGWNNYDWSAVRSVRQ